MIIYFADRHMNILGQASTSLPEGFVLVSDKKIEDVETGVASFSFKFNYLKKDRLAAEKMCKAGNYILLKNGSSDEFYTVIDSEIETSKQEIYIYAEDAGLDLLNEVAEAYESTEAHPISWYIDKWTNDSGFVIGINELPELSRKLKWDGEDSVTRRLASIATQFDNAEINYTFDIEGLRVVHKKINIYKKRGKNIGEELRLNKHLRNITIKTSVANLATAVRAKGGMPDDSETPVTLKGYSYDDGDFYIDSEGILKSREAVKKWSRFCADNSLGNHESHIVTTYSYDTTNQQTLLAHSLTHLKSICDMEVNFEAEVIRLPNTIKLGDEVNIIDEFGELYISSRLLKLETSITDDSETATFGDFLIRESGINAEIENLAFQFSQIAKSRVFYTWIAYADDSNGTGISLDSTNKAYIGVAPNRTTETVELSNPTIFKWSRIEGSPGISITGIVEYYMVSNLAEGITRDTTGWNTSIPTITANNKYLWNYEKFVYSDGSETFSDPKVIGAYGDSGKEPPSIAKMTKQYYLSSSKTELSEGTWSNNIPEWASGKYIWSRWCTEWSEPNPTILTYSEGIVETTWNEVKESTATANTLATEAKTSAESAVSQVGIVNSELASTNAQIETLSGNLETLETTLSTDYATKGELTSAQTTLNASIEANAAGLSTAVGRIDQVEIDSSQAIADAEAAQTAANNARTVADEATEKYNTLKTQADATDEQLAQAKLDVQTAQAAAEEAQNAADTAQAAANSLGDRVTTTETNISQNATNISSVATRVTTIEDNYIDSSEIANLTSTFNQTAEEITLGIVAGYTSKDELNTYKHEVENMFSANEQGFEFNFNRLEQQLNEVGGEVNAQKEYIRLINGEIHIGKNGNPVTSVYTNNALEFRYNGVTVAKFTNETLEVRNITSENQVAFFGDWAIRKGAEVSGKGYNLNDIWIGG